MVGLETDPRENYHMDGLSIIQAAIAARTARGLGLRCFGVEGYTAEAPFTCYAKDEAQRDRWLDGFRAKGFTVEVMS